MTGATNYIGSVVAEKLLQTGHQVVGPARSEAAAQTLEKQGIEPYDGDLNNPETLTAAARAADGAIHTAFDRSQVSKTVTTQRGGMRLPVHGG